MNINPADIIVNSANFVNMLLPILTAAVIIKKNTLKRKKMGPSPSFLVT